MPSITITPLQPNDTKAFIKFPWQVYAGDPYWIPPLIMDRKAFLNRARIPFSSTLRCSCSWRTTAAARWAASPR